MNVQSGWLLPTGQTRADTRLTALGATTPADPVTVHSGILPGSYDGTFTVSGFWLQGISAMTGRVSEGRAVIQGTITQGAYPLAMPTSTDLTFTDGDPQYDRIDLVVLRVYDNAYDGSGRTETTCEIIEGTPAATPTAPATPDLALPLYQVTVPATASAGNGGIPWTTALTDQRTTTVAIGGILPAYGTTANGAYLGQYRDLNGTLQRWDGTTWQDYPQALGGIAPAGHLTTPSYTGQYRDNGTTLQRWDGTAWNSPVPGPVFASTTDAGNTSSTTYTATLGDTPAGSTLGLTFVAPPSGTVLVSTGSRMKTSADAGAYGYICPEIKEGGTVVKAAADREAAVSSSDASTSVATTYPLGSLTPGVTYTVTVFYRSALSTVNCWFDNRYVRIDPVL
ncbi:hypothetical protein ACL02U_06275 [Streptomyces sp. MS06]|uniref:hypothetical protein n=1 Tax=Streptomyces sp. MS06 TaxID=3385974 RepID=UPI0039A07AE0